MLLLPDIGSVIWLVAGHPWQPTNRPGGLPYKGNTGYATRGHGAGPSPRGRAVSARATNPDDDAEFLRKLRERAEEQRRVVRPEDPPAI